MATHLILERSHHGPRLIGTFRNRLDAEAMRGGLIQDNPTWAEARSVVSYEDSDETPIEIETLVVSVGEDTPTVL